MYIIKVKFCNPTLVWENQEWRRVDSPIGPFCDKQKFLGCCFLHSINSKLHSLISEIKIIDFDLELEI